LTRENELNSLTERATFSAEPPPTVKGWGRREEKSGDADLFSESTGKEEKVVATVVIPTEEKDRIRERWRTTKKVTAEGEGAVFTYKACPYPHPGRAWVNEKNTTDNDQKERSFQLKRVQGFH